ncbi:terpene synthase family protein [Nocardia wallacei]|uniref:terpene synthase family protein n=1 Tax=Nocardia wallacei TaxID=480035 RepID=UPI002458EA52|nr:hypothetical protein [Nocardia wallacei]
MAVHRTVHPSTAQRYSLPPFYCPIPPVLNPNLARVTERAWRWTERVGLYRTDADREWGRATHSGEWACRLIPEPSAEDVAVLFARWNYWLFAVDDLLDEDAVGDTATTVSAGHTIEFAWRMIRGIEHPGARLDRPGADLVPATRAAVSAVQWQRITRAVRDWMLAATLEAATTERASLPALDDYLAVCAEGSGFRFFFGWMEIGAGVEVPPERLYAPGPQALAHLAGTIIRIDNDLMGYRKGDHLDPPAQNIANILVRHRGCALPDAMAEAAALRDRLMLRFLQLADRIGGSPACGPALRRYIAGLGHTIRANLDWGNTAPRYASPRNHHAHPDPTATCGISVTDAAPAPPTGPPRDAPAVAWWWDRSLDRL